MEKTAIKILIVDDYASIRERISELIKQHYRSAIISEAVTGNHALIKIYNEAPDLIILDIRIPERNGIEVLKKIRSQLIATPVLIISSYLPQQYIKETLKAGATACLDKKELSEHLLSVIERIISSGKNSF